MKKLRKRIVAVPKVDMPVYAVSSVGQDVYDQYVEESELDPENPAQTKEPNEEPGQRNEKDFSEDQSGDDLDVPGTELDDEQEKIGSEDEENNYYSIGGDNHNDLEENREEML